MNFVPHDDEYDDDDDDDDDDDSYDSDDDDDEHDYHINHDFLKTFSQGFEINVLERPSPQDLVVEMIGVDPSFINALRRILISEVPTMAFDRVYIHQNTSIIDDRVLAHRVGMLPVDVDARRFAFLRGHEFVDGSEVMDGVVESQTEWNTIVFQLEVSCGAPPDQRERRKEEEKAVDDAVAAAVAVALGTDDNNNNTDDEDDDDDEENDDDDNNNKQQHQELEEVARAAAVHRLSVIEFPNRPYTKNVYSKEFQWFPQGKQAMFYPPASSDAIRLVHDDILFAKLRPGQVIQLEAYARKGVGKDHAKFSPVATATYRLMPKVEILQDVYDDVAEELLEYEPGVFELVPSNKAGTHVKARVADPTLCTMSRNFQRHAILSKAIRISRVPYHYIMTIEAVGTSVSPAVLLAEAIKVLQGKCQRLMRMVNRKVKQENLLMERRNVKSIY